MKIAISVCMGVALLAMAGTAQAAAPKVSGKYALMIVTQCEARFTTQGENYLRPPASAPTTGPGIKALNTSQSGELGIGVGTLTLPATAASSGNADLEAFLVGGGSLRINNTGQAMSTHTEATPGAFLFSVVDPANPTFTFDPTGPDPAMIWTIRAGHFVNGVARTIYLVRKEDARCLNAITATKQ